jgi:hypothetical protein
LNSQLFLDIQIMAMRVNAPSAGEIWHLSIEDLFAPAQEPQRLGGDGPFVINLSASTAPINLPKKPFDVCPDAHIYLIQATEDKRVRYRLRLGSFVFEDDANAVLQEVREIYPAAVTASACAQDIRHIESMQARVEAKKAPARKAAKAAAERAAAERAAAVKAAAELAEQRLAAERAAAEIAVKRLTEERAAAERAAKRLAAEKAAAEKAAAERAAAERAAQKLAAEKLAAEKAAAERAAAEKWAAEKAAAEKLAAEKAAAERAAQKLAAEKLAAEKAAAERAATERLAAEKAAAEKLAAAKAAAEKLAAEKAAAQKLAAEKAAAERAAQKLAAEKLAAEKAAAERAATERLAAEKAAAKRAAAEKVAAEKAAAEKAAAKKLTAVPAPREVKRLSNPLPDLESTQTIRALTPPELEDRESSQWFVIELAVAGQEFDPAAVPHLDIFDEYRLYSVAGLDQGRTVHSLRLGFFTQEIAAIMVASYLGAHYNKPTIRRVSVAERERFAHHRVEARKDIGETSTHAVIEITDELVVRRKRAAPAPMTDTQAVIGRFGSVPQR